jgi:hypothetical protein
MTMRAFSAVLVTAAVALGAAACGDDDGPDKNKPTAEPEVTLDEARKAAADRKGEKPAAAPNVLGGERAIGRVLPQLDDDLTAFFAETLAPAGAQVTGAQVRREAGPCDGKQVTAADPPQFCRAEKVVFEPESGSDAVRNKDGAAALYTLVAWAHAQAAGEQLGWEEEVAAGRYTREQVAESDFCLLYAWLGYTDLQGIFENSDYEIIDATFAHPLFNEVPQAARQRAVEKGRIGAELCVA